MVEGHPIQEQDNDNSTCSSGGTGLCPAGALKDCVDQ